MAKRRMDELERSMTEARSPKVSVEADLARLGGKSRSDLVADHRRGGSSPLGKGSHSKEKKRGRGR
jgi:hypothetical protein